MDYYLTRVHPDGTTLGPTRLLGIHNNAEAVKSLRKYSVRYPQDTIEIEAIITWEDVGKRSHKFIIEPETKRCPKCKRFVGKNQKCSKCLE